MPDTPDPTPLTASQLLAIALGTASAPDVPPHPVAADEAEEPPAEVPAAP